MLPEGLPRVRGDAERLGQVMVNLLHNAIKFSPGGATVTVGAHPADDSVALEVRDQGVGIPRAERDRIFERFYKVDKARERGQGGTGRNKREHSNPVVFRLVRPISLGGHLFRRGCEHGHDTGQRCRHPFPGSYCAFA